MRVLLNDGEIAGAIDVANGGAEWREGWEVQDVIEEQDRSIAKTQLGKLVRWANKRCKHFNGTVKHWDCEKCYQALLKEIE